MSKKEQFLKEYENIYFYSTINDQLKQGLIDIDNELVIKSQEYLISLIKLIDSGYHITSVLDKLYKDISIYEKSTILTFLFYILNIDKGPTTQMISILEHYQTRKYVGYCRHYIKCQFLNGDDKTKQTTHPIKLDAQYRYWDLKQRINGNTQ